MKIFSTPKINTGSPQFLRLSRKYGEINFGGLCKKTAVVHALMHKIMYIIIFAFKHPKLETDFCLDEPWTYTETDKQNESTCKYLIKNIKYKYQYYPLL